MSASPWIWSRSVDLGVFGGSALLALALAACAGTLAPEGHVPFWAWLLFVLGIDVAHVWTTLFRTYLDPEELARRRGLYLGLPVACYLIGVGLHSVSSLTFWRVLAYVAVFHFVRQQVGWVAIYRARAGERAALDRRLDAAVVYAATGWPLLYWHAHLPRAFAWFVPQDFLGLAAFQPLVAPLGGVYAALVAAYVARAIQVARRGPVNTGKHVVVASTSAIWLVGIVMFDDDFAFTVTNVTVHGIPYMALLWAYARARAEELPRRALLPRVVGWGLAAFLGVALGFAFLEELLWERLVWHDRPGWFGGEVRAEPLLDGAARALLVPLLALPQAVHYALDGVLWRRRDGGRAQARALGFSPVAASPP